MSKMYRNNQTIENIEDIDRKKIPEDSDSDSDASKSKIQKSIKTRLPVKKIKAPPSESDTESDIEEEIVETKESLLKLWKKDKSVLIKKHNVNENEFELLLKSKSTSTEINDYLKNNWIDSKDVSEKTVKTFHYDDIVYEYRVPLMAQHVWKCILSPKFRKWINSMKEQEHFKVEKILITDIDMFGPVVGFIKFKVFYKDDRNSKAFPSIVFMRGDSVAILMILQTPKRRYTLLTEQPRVPAGEDTFLEIPAGMLDEKTGDIIGVAAKEIKEETGISINKKELLDLGVMAPSVGGCDERIHLFLYVKEVTYKEIKELQGKMTGNLKEGEAIKVRIIPYSDLPKTTDDAKAICTMFRYNKILEEETE